MSRSADMASLRCSDGSVPSSPSRRSSVGLDRRRAVVAAWIDPAALVLRETVGHESIRRSLKRVADQREGGAILTLPRRARIWKSRSGDAYEKSDASDEL